MGGTSWPAELMHANTETFSLQFPTLAGMLRSPFLANILLGLWVRGTLVSSMFRIRSGRLPRLRFCITCVSSWKYFSVTILFRHFARTDVTAVGCLNEMSGVSPQEAILQPVISRGTPSRNGVVNFRRLAIWPAFSISCWRVMPKP